MKLKYKQFENSYIKFVCYFSKFKSLDDVMSVKFRIHILPSLSFHFNSYSFGIHFNWLNFNTWFEYMNFTKRRKYL